MTLHFLHLKNYPIIQQLQLEEALLRSDNRSYCLINEGTPPSIVLGISGNPIELLHLEPLKKEKIPVIQRFSGGGCVFVDEATIFITFIFSKKDLDISPFPESILKWTEALYKKAFPLPDFHLRENDYVIGNQKCAGNAQYIQNKRWLHHTSFLWDYDKHKMELLKHPKKTPSYRADRDHKDFLCRLKDHIEDKESLLLSLKKTLGEMFELSEISLSESEAFASTPHRKSTKILPL